MEEERKEDQTEFKPSWFNFLMYMAFSALCFYTKTWAYLPAIICAIFAILSFPNEKIHSQIMIIIEKIKIMIGKLLYLLLVIGIIWFIIWIIGKTFSRIGNIGKYEGQTAKEWYYDYIDAEDRYEDFRSCVSDYDSFDIRTQVEYGGVFYYCD